ncbi:hypothetical protein B296_00046489 [Ensete ventricosum]|uniref:Uncharacterized protein n=1 Tax=Ensete ventricosum TaxID=4639 RepID=A0A426XAR8_ENSVE|nr:hypothetical protein B296_00046489 [Ensete ventricosum]
MQSNDLKRALQCLLTMSNSRDVGQETTAADITEILSLTAVKQENLVDAVQGIAKFAKEFLDLIDAADATGQADIAREALKRLASAGSVKGALQGQVLKGLALRLANHGELTRLSVLTLCKKHGSEVMMMSTQCLQKLAEISRASTESSRLLPTRLYNLHMLILQEEPLAHIRLYCCPHPQRAESKRIVQETQETQIIQPRPSLARILYLQKLYLFVCRYKLFLKYHIQPNQLWLLKYSQISSYFYDFSKEWTIMLKTLPNDDHRSMAHDRKKIVSFQHNTGMESVTPNFIG